jgi:2-keto-4-pentenoate hydratase
VTPQQRDAAAALLRTAAQSGQPIAPLRDAYPGMTADDAYAIQAINTTRRIAEGRRLVGSKIGLTSQAVQRQLGVDQPDFGALLDDMSYGDSETIPMSVLQQPKIEAEIAFVLGRDIDMHNPTHHEVLRAVDYVVPALEVVGSRIADWNIRFVDTVADNASSGVYVLGATPMSVRGLDLGLAGMCLSRRGEPVSTGVGAACLGNPVNALVWLARTMARLGKPMRAGELVLSGALGPMVAVQPGDVFECHIHGVGSVRAEFEAKRQTDGAAA